MKRMKVSPMLSEECDLLCELLVINVPNYALVKPVAQCTYVSGVSVTLCLRSYLL